MSVYETIKMSPLLGLQGSGGGLAYLAGLVGADKTYVNDVFSTFLYTGNDTAGHQINNGIDLAGEGGIVWIKKRSATDNNLITNTAGKYLNTNLSNGESTSTNFISSFNSNGFTLGQGVQGSNSDGADIASWSFRKAPGFFDVVTYTGSGTADRAIAHNLGSVPGMVIVKRTNGVNNWFTYHRSLASPLTKWLGLNRTDAEMQANIGTNMWGSMTSTHIGVRDYFGLNAVGGTFVAYIFAHDDAQYGTGGDESIIKCGSYTGNGSTTGTVVNLGFEPQFVLMKNTTRASQWMMFDNMRGIANGGNDNYLHPSDTDAEYTGADYLDLTTTGFQLKSTATTVNQNGDSYIYMAIARPNKPPTAATEVFAPTYRASNGMNIKETTGFPVDLLLYHYGDAVNAFDRLRGLNRLRTPYGYAEGGYSPDALDYSDGWKNAAFNGSVSLGYSFRRAPGFFDMVTYTGNLTARTINHNLSAVPELLIVKNRTDSAGWAVWSSYLSQGYALLLNDHAQAIDRGTQYWNTNSTFTTTTFGLGNQPPTNQNNHKFIGYLFASLAGISKIGTYSGNTGYAVNVPCGFTNGARFVLIKRTDAEISGATGTGWYVWDTARGIVSGNDSYIQLNQPLAQVTNTDYIDPLSTGFTVTASAPAALNVNGGTYLFLAIA